MVYFISFLEGIITFISPCLLPMLPIYISYFAGGKERSTAATIKNAIGFICGFTIVFLLMGALAGSLGSLVKQHQIFVNIVTGAIVVFFGLHFMGIFRITLFKGMKSDVLKEDMGFFSTLLFGIVFSLGWTPCVGAFLGSALMLASQQGQMLTGILMLLCYSLGLAIPFLISALLIDKLRSTFQWIKNHYKIINTVCGGFLVLIGVLMMSGLLGRFLTILS